MKSIFQSVLESRAVISSYLPINYATNGTLRQGHTSNSVMIKSCGQCVLSRATKGGPTDVPLSRYNGGVKVLSAAAFYFPASDWAASKYL